MNDMTGQFTSGGASLAEQMKNLIDDMLKYRLDIEAGVFRDLDDTVDVFELDLYERAVVGENGIALEDLFAQGIVGVDIGGLASGMQNLEIQAFQVRKGPCKGCVRGIVSKGLNGDKRRQQGQPEKDSTHFCFLPLREALFKC